MQRQSAMQANFATVCRVLNSDPASILASPPPQASEKRIPQALKGDGSQPIRELYRAAEEIAVYAAKHIPEREDIVTELRQHGVEPWTRLGEWWAAIADHFEPGNTAHDSYFISMSTSLAKMERNLVAGLVDHQAAAVSHEEAVRRIIFHLTTFARIEDPGYLTIQATMVQLLSNLVSPVPVNDPSDKRVDEVMGKILSGRREDDVIIRLLDSQDSKVNAATLHLLNNTTRGSRSRLALLLEYPGLAWLSKILARTDEWHSAEDGRFELACSLIRSYIHFGLHSRLFGELAVANEPISPSQTTLLKILDSELSSELSSVQADSDRAENAESTRANYFLVPVFHLLSAYAHTSITHVPDDARLPKVFEALVLVSEALCNIGLIAQARKDMTGESGAEETSSARLGSEPSGTDAVVAGMKSPEDGEGVVRPVLDLLRSLDALIPRLNPRTARLDPSVADNAGVSPDQLRPIAQLKRSLVQLLGTLSFEDTAVGDQVRDCEGIQLLLSMTEVDENSPYLREHALFAVRNLMLNNPANQAIVREMDPVGVLSDTGELLPVPDRMKRHP